MYKKDKYGIKKSHAILLFIQMIFFIIGFLAQIGILIFVIKNNLEPIMIISSISIILSFIAIFIYAIYGFNKKDIYYIIAIAFFLLAILINNILPFRDIFQKITLTLLFGIYSSYIFALKNYKLSNYIILFATIISLTFSIYSSITSNINSLGTVENGFLTFLMMHISIFTPVIITILFGATCLVRNEKRKNIE